MAIGTLKRENVRSHIQPKILTAPKGAWVKGFSMNWGDIDAGETTNYKAPFSVSTPCFNWIKVGPGATNVKIRVRRTNTGEDFALSNQGGVELIGLWGSDETISAANHVARKLNSGIQLDFGNDTITGVRDANWIYSPVSSGALDGADYIGLFFDIPATSAALETETVEGWALLY